MRGKAFFFSIVPSFPKGVSEEAVHHSRFYLVVSLS